MLQGLVLLAVGGHGIGHTVSFWVEAPRWFQIAWLAPGLGFVAGAVLMWQHDPRWIPVMAGAAIVSLGLELAAPGLLKPGPYANAFIFNVAVLVALALPVTRTWLTQL